MAEITAALVKELREMTGAGMMDCKKALVATEGSIEKAVDYLRENGLAKAAKKSGRIAAEGLVRFAFNEDHTKASIIEVNSESDFVSKNPEFIEFVENLAKLGLDDDVKCENCLMSKQYGTEGTVEEVLTAKIAKISENYTYAVLLMSYVGIFNEHRLPPAPNIRCNCDVEGKSKCCIFTA